MALPNPSHWPIARVNDVLGWPLLALVATGYLVAALAGIGSAGVWEGLAVVAFVYPEAYLSLPRRGAPEAGERALVFAASRVRLVLSAAVALLWAVAVAVLAGLPSGLLAGGGSLAFIALTQRNVVLDVALDAEGVTVRTVRLRRWVPWAAVDGTVDMPKPAFLRVGDRHRLRTQVLAAAPEVLYWTLRHYAERPQDRDELADGRAVARVRDRDLVPASLAERAVTMA